LAEHVEERAYLALGGNMGDREAYLRKALYQLDVHTHIRLERCSPVYETAPVGLTDQAAFLNMAAAVSTDLDPAELLAALHQIEQRLGRERVIRWGPRTIDLDILLYGMHHIQTPNLEIPHPRMGERLFVLIPLNDIYMEETVPGIGDLADRLQSLEDHDDVKWWGRPLWPPAEDGQVKQGGSS
jgi:2-amino-4-hydroxy-6-hydroxymethyldihydropteridine diphosphokinase